MSFQENAQSLRCKLHMSEVSQPVLVGMVALVLAVLLLSGFALVRFFTNDSLTFSLQGESQAESSEVAESETDGAGAHDASGEAGGSDALASQDDIYVHVSGEVASPGVVCLPKGSRAFDAIEMAGGFTDSASPDSINLAREVQDGEQLYVLSLDEAAGGAQLGSSASAPSGASASVLPNGLININTADQAALESLPGIGESTARKIIQERESNGPFATVDDLKRVSGIGDKKLESLREYVCVQ